MKTKHKVLVACILGLILALAAVLLRRRRRRAQPNHQAPIEV